MNESVPFCQDHGPLELTLVFESSGGFRKNFWKCPICARWLPARSVEEAERTETTVDYFGGSSNSPTAQNPLADSMKVRRNNDDPK